MVLTQRWLQPALLHQRQSLAAACPYLAGRAAGSKRPSVRNSNRSSEHSHGCKRTLRQAPARKRTGISSHSKRSPHRCPDRALISPEEPIKRRQPVQQTPVVEPELPPAHESTPAQQTEHEASAPAPLAGSGIAPGADRSAAAPHSLQPQPLTAQLSLPERLSLPSTLPRLPSATQQLPRDLSTTFQQMMEPLPSTAAVAHGPGKETPAASAEPSRLPALSLLATQPPPPLTHSAAPRTEASLPNIKSLVSSKPLAVLGTDLTDSTTVAQTAKTRLMGLFCSALVAAFATAAKDHQISAKEAYVLSSFTELTRRIMEIDYAIKAYQFYSSVDEAKHADSVALGPIHGNYLFDTIIQIWTVPACAGALGEWDAFYHAKVKRLREGVASAMNSSAARISFHQLVKYMEDFSYQLQISINSFVKEANKLAGRHMAQSQLRYSLFDAHNGWLRQLMKALPQSDTQFGFSTGGLPRSSVSPAPSLPFHRPATPAIPDFPAPVSAHGSIAPWPALSAHGPPSGAHSHFAAAPAAWDAHSPVPHAAPAESAFSVQPPQAASRVVSKRANLSQELAAKRERCRQAVIQAGSAPDETRRVRALTEGVCMNHTKFLLGTRPQDCYSEEDCRFAHFSIEDLLSFGYPRDTINSAASAVSRKGRGRG